MYKTMTLIGIRLLLILMLAGCSGFFCSDDVIQEVVSPDGKFVATVFERNCGATTPYLRIVSLRVAKNSFDAEAYNNWVFKINGQPKVQIVWSDFDKLSITYSGGGGAPTLIESWKEVKINYL